MEKFRLQIITPERIFYDGEASFIEFTSTEGRTGIYANHEPVTLLLSPCMLLIENENDEKKAALHNGFAVVEGDSVRVLAQIAEWPEEIDANRAKEAKIRAERRLTDGNSDIERAEAALKRALARLETKNS